MKISIDEANQLLAYLQEQPYKEVSDLIAMLHKAFQDSKARKKPEVDNKKSKKKK